MTMIPIDITKPPTSGTRASAEVRNNFAALFNGDEAPLRPRAQASPNMTILVGGSDVESFWRQIWVGVLVPLSYGGGNSPTVTAPSTNPRIDLLTIDSAGTLAWTVGAEAASPVAPNCPSGKIPICYIYCRTTMTKIYNFEDAGSYPTHGYIYRDVRPFLMLAPPPVTPSWIPLDPEAKSEFYDDFVGSVITQSITIFYSNHSWNIIGNAFAVAGTNGIARIAGDTTNAPSLFLTDLTTQLPFIVAKNPIIKMRQSIFGANNNTRRSGLSTVLFNSSDRDGIYIRSGNANLFGVCRSGGVESTLDLGVAPSAGTFHTFRMVVTSAGASVEFFLDGVSKGSITTHIPSAAMLVNFNSDSSGSGNGQDIDYIHIIQDR